MLKSRRNDSQPLSIKEISTPIFGLDTLDNRFKSARYVCVHEFPELTAVCPVTRLPDFYDIKVEYEPNKKLVELKSFKLFLNRFRDKEILHEEITNEILNKLIKSIEPRWARIIVKVNVRGGIFTTIIREWSKEAGDIVSNEPIANAKLNC